MNIIAIGFIVLALFVGVYLVIRSQPQPKSWSIDQETEVPEFKDREREWLK